MAPKNESSFVFQLIGTLRKVSIDYTPQWKRGNPSAFIDSVTFPLVLTDKDYKYRVVIGGWENGKDLGVRKSYKVSSDGSQTVNFLEYNSGYGIEDSNTILVYVVDPDNGNQTLVAQHN